MKISLCSTRLMSVTLVYFIFVTTSWTWPHIHHHHHGSGHHEHHAVAASSGSGCTNLTSEGNNISMVRRCLTRHAADLLNIRSGYGLLTWIWTCRLVFCLPPWKRAYLSLGVFDTVCGLRAVYRHCRHSGYFACAVGHRKHDATYL